MDLLSTIQNLQSLQKEGDYWDFKQKHHVNPVDLVHDIICLANTTCHKGERYLIIGIDDNFQTVGVDESDPNRKNQANILDVLSNVNFAGGLYPDVKLEIILFENKTLDVIIISDKPEKPFYLQKEYSKNNKKINAGTIYSRVRDRNTAKNGVAQTSDIEMMWKERFGLSQNPLERFDNYIVDYDFWNRDNETKHYYKLFPEFTLNYTEDMKDFRGISWARCCPDASGAHLLEVYGSYHTTELWRETLILMDGGRRYVPYTDFDLINVDDENTKILYSYTLGTRRHNLFLYFCGDGIHRSMRLPILIFDSKEEREMFIDFLQNNIHEVKPAEYARIGGWHASNFRDEEEEIKFNFGVIDLYKQWRDNSEGEFSAT